MLSSIVRKVLFLSVTLLVLVSCSREGTNMKTDKAKPDSLKSATTTTASKTVSKTTRAEKAAPLTSKGAFGYNGITQFQDR